MAVQLLLIGYILTYLFEAKSPYLVVGLLTIMLLAASVISMRPVQHRRPKLYQYAFIAISLGGGVTLLCIMIAVLDNEIWYEPKFIIPLAGMTFANAMNAVSIAAERFESELVREVGYKEARGIAYKAALIPIINAFFAVGLVSLPGMMTGQILSGVDPMIAVRYQIMVMLMILSSAGLSVALYLVQLSREKR